MNVARMLFALIVTVAVGLLLAAVLEPTGPTDHPPHQGRRDGAARGPGAGAASGPPEHYLENAIERATRAVVYITRTDQQHQADQLAAAREGGVTPPDDPGVAAPPAEGPPSSGDVDSTLACIRAHESDTAGGYQAVNGSSGAGGAYQALPSTWDGYGGYAHAEDAPPDVQDAWAREAIAAAGTRPWNGSGC